MKIRLSTLIPLLICMMLLSCTDELSELQTRTFVKFYGSYKNDQGNDVIALPDGGYAVLGNIVPDSIVKMALIITDEAGNQVEGSPHTYGGRYRTGGKAMILLQDGYLLGGTLTDTTPDSEFQTDIYLVRTDLQGNEIWSRRYGGDENDALLHLAERNNGGFVLAGKKTMEEEEDRWILMVDENGIMQNYFGGPDLIRNGDDDEVNFVMPTDDGYLCACTYDGGSMEGTDLFIVHLDDN